MSAIIQEDFNASATTVFEVRPQRLSINEQFELQFFPGAIEKGKDEYLVEFEEGDPLNPKNWNPLYRWFLTVLSGIIVLNASFSSSAPGGIVGQLREQFGMSSEVGILVIALFVAGYIVGPIFWGPLSEVYGRRPIFIVSFVVYTGFQVGSALANNTASVLIFRLLGGIFAAAPLTNSGALLSDIWDAGPRGKALAVFTVAPFAGPSLGPIVGGYIDTAGVSWRWLFWVLTMFAGVCTLAIIFFVPETFAPIIMAKKAKAIRLKTGDENYYAPIERQPKMSIGKRLESTIARPFLILFQEPMLIATTAYMSFAYGCVYLLFEAFPIVFVEGHGFSNGAGGLMFITIFVGSVLAAIVNLFWFNPRYERLIEQHKPNPVPPEARLDLAIVGGPIFAIGFFWFGWTSFPSISYWAPMLSGVALGFSVILIFLALFNYTIDAYLFVAASALAANTAVRSSFGAAFPLFATQMFEKMNPRWASTLLGCISLLMVPIPIVLKKYGAKIRMRSKNAPTISVKEKELKLEAQ